MSFVRHHLVLILGLLLFVLGGSQAVWSAVVIQTGSFGWTAYAPMTSTTFSPTPVSGPIALVIAVLGVALTMGWLGRRFAKPSAPGIRRFWTLFVAIALLVVVPFLAQPVGFGVTTLVSPAGVDPIVLVPAAVAIRSIITLVVILLVGGFLAWWVGAQTVRLRPRLRPRPAAADAPAAD